MLKKHLIKAGHSHYAEYTFNQSRSLIMLNKHLIKAGHSQHADYTFNQSGSLSTCRIYI